MHASDRKKVHTFLPHGIGNNCEVRRVNTPPEPEKSAGDCTRWWRGERQARKALGKCGNRVGGNEARRQKDVGELEEPRPLARLRCLPLPDNHIYALSPSATKLSARVGPHGVKTKQTNVRPNPSLKLAETHSSVWCKIAILAVLQE